MLGEAEETGFVYSGEEKTKAGADLTTVFVQEESVLHQAECHQQVE